MAFLAHLSVTLSQSSLIWFPCQTLSSNNNPRIQNQLKLNHWVSEWVSVSESEVFIWRKRNAKVGVKALQRGGQQSVDSMRRVSTKLRFFGLLLRWLLLRQLLAHPDSLFHLGLAQPRCLTPLSCSQTPRFLSFPYYYYYYYFLIHRSISFSTLQVLYYLLFLNVVWLLICGVWFSCEILIVFWVFILIH